MNMFISVFGVHVCTVKGATRVAVSLHHFTAVLQFSRKLSLCPSTSPAASKLVITILGKALLQITVTVMVNNVVQFSVFVTVLNNSQQIIMIIIWGTR
jgi:hypothetical protein